MALFLYIRTTKTFKYKKKRYQQVSYTTRRCVEGASKPGAIHTYVYTELATPVSRRARALLTCGEKRNMIIMRVRIMGDDDDNDNNNNGTCDISI